MQPVIFFIILTTIILFLGLVVMGSGEKLSKKYSNKLMLLRVICQASAIIFLVIIGLLQH